MWARGRTAGPMAGPALARAPPRPAGSTVRAAARHAAARSPGTPRATRPGWVRARRSVPGRNRRAPTDRSRGRHGAGEGRQRAPRPVGSSHAERPQPARLVSRSRRGARFVLPSHGPRAPGRSSFDDRAPAAPRSTRTFGPMLKRLWQRLRGAGSPARLGISVGLGLFIGCLPLYGLHLPLCLLVCLPFRLDVVAAYLAAHVSNPLFAPFLLVAEAELGAVVLGRLPLTAAFESASELGWDEILVRTAVGSVVLGAVLGAAGGALAAGIARGRSSADDALEAARRRTGARYRNVPPADRWYVASKLRTDPVAEQVAALGPLGDVLDVGCGRGQLGPFLVELERVSRPVGSDLDGREVHVAQGAGGADATFSASDVATTALAPVDTVLLI